MARTALALLLASRAAALVPSLRSAAVATPKTVTQVSYLSEVEDADKKKKWWDQDDEGREESNPRDHTGVGEADSNYGPTNYEGFIDADGYVHLWAAQPEEGDAKFCRFEGEVELPDPVEAPERINWRDDT